MASSSDADLSGSSTVPLRVISGLLLLGASAAGVLPPILRGVNQAEALEASAGSHRMKAFAAGVMLGLAVMHVIADGDHLDALCLLKIKICALPVFYDCMCTSKYVFFS